MAARVGHVGVVLEGRLHRRRDAQPGRPGRGVDRIALGEHRGRRVELGRRLVEAPVAHRVADARREAPVPGRGHDRVVPGARRGTRVEQGQVRVARDPGPPEVVVLWPGCAPRGGRAVRASPAGPRRARRDRARGRRRLVCADVRRRRPPRRPAAPRPGAFGDRLRECQRRSVGVILGLGRLAADRPPGVERDLRGREGRRELVARGLDLERLGGLERVVRGERLVRPAVGEQRTVEPGVGGLVEDHEVGRVVGDLDEALRRIEEARVAAGRAADRLLDDEWIRRAARTAPRHRRGPAAGLGDQAFDALRATPGRRASH